MESRAGTKRPWENEECIEVHSKRRGSTLTASLVRQLSPLPPQTGFYAHDRPTLDHTILPPLLTSPYSGTDIPITSSSSQCWPPPQALELLDGSKRRSHSLVQAFDHRHRPGDQRIHKEPPTIYSRIPGLSATSPPSGATVNPGPDPPHASAVGLKDLTRTEHQASYKPPEPSHTKFEESLQWALDLVHESNLRLQEHVEQRSSRSPRSQTPPDDSPNMRRSQHYLEEREEQSPPTRHHTLHHDYGQLLRSNASPGDPRRNPYGMVATIVGNSPRQTATVPGNVYMPPQSPPIQAPQSMHSNLLPSPSSLNFSSSQSLPSMTPPISTHASAHSTLLQDLQHQVTVKTLEFRTLQREYDALLQKLERQKTKCTTLEKKFEVSDVEINSLTDEKEKLQAQVTNMEGQVEELQQSRDEARRQLIANGAQYMRIMEMANRLQTQSADDKKKWEAEKSELEQRIRVLEEAMVTGGEHRTPAASGIGTGTRNQATSTAAAATSPPTNYNTTTSAPPPLSSTSQTETINVLRAEVSRLRSRTQTLESAVKTMRRESISIQTAARQLVDSSGKLEDVAQGIVGEGG